MTTELTLEKIKDRLPKIKNAYGFQIIGQEDCCWLLESCNWLIDKAEELRTVQERLDNQNKYNLEKAVRIAELQEENEKLKKVVECAKGMRGYLVGDELRTMIFDDALKELEGES